MNKANIKLFLIVVGGVLAATYAKNNIAPVRRVIGS